MDVFSRLAKLALWATESPTKRTFDFDRNRVCFLLGLGEAPLEVGGEGVGGTAVGATVGATVGAAGGVTV